jgi:hypothetical protein
MIDHILNQEGFIVETTTDKHGDQVEDKLTPVRCRFRYITGIEKGINAEDFQGSNAMIWFAPDANIEEGSVVQVDSKYWRVDRLIRARKMSGSTVEFLKAFVKNHQLVTV